MVEAIPDHEGVDRKRHLFDSLDEAHKFGLPKWMIEREFGRIWRHWKAEYRVGRVDPEDLRKSEVQLKREYRAIAERRVRLGLVLKAIARRNEIKLTRDEIAAARATGYRGPLDAILELKIVEFIFGLAGMAPE
jgi:trigger factor